MNQTLFTISHDFIHDYLLWIWLVAGGLILLVWTARQGWAQAAGQFLPTFSVVAVAIYFLLPRLEVLDIDPQNPLGPLIPIGLAIRGYGVFLTLAIVSAVALVLYRCHQVGLNGERVLSLCFWMIVIGIVSARLFYVFQKWEQFDIQSPADFLGAIIDMTHGGLVVYGSFIGGVLAALFFFHRYQLPTWQTLDVLAPGMMLGLAIGRIGCLMNGCCYGGVCDPEYALGLNFPAGSPPYIRQLESGQLLGIVGTYDPKLDLPITVNEVKPGSPADKLGIQPQERLRVDLNGQLLALLGPVLFKQVQADVHLEILSSRKSIFRWPVTDLPQWSAPVHPTQIYATTSGLLLAALLWFFFPFRQYQGQVFVGLLLLYPVCRYLEEAIRDDEPGWLGTPWTISQWISMVLFGVGIVVAVLLPRWSGRPGSTGRETTPTDRRINPDIR